MTLSATQSLILYEAAQHAARLAPLPKIRLPPVQDRLDDVGGQQHEAQEA